MRRNGFLLVLLLLLSLCGCGQAEKPAETDGADIAWDALERTHSMDLLYADQFSVDYLQNGCKIITIGDADTYLVVPEGAPIPSGVPEEVTVIQQPVDSVYLVATSAMDLFRELDAIDAVTLSGTDAAGWYIQEAKAAMEAGEMVYAGKYSAPDYELILEQGCGLAVESTMIYHTPEVMEQLERFGIPVLVERSSYESHPLGRMEWIKLYAALLGKEEAAQAYFDRQMETLAPILEQENTGKTVAFFYITSNGAVNVRRPEDYIAKAIDLAGGVYIFQDLPAEDSARSTMNMQMEAFYEGARDADVLIYNSAIDGELQTMEDLLDKSGLLADFKAVREGRVWCTGKNLFQESLGLGALIADLHAIVDADDPDGLDLTYLHQLS
ncbi:ABC transporter substrate-binding protein [uncultured Dysosmobacter sp.]|uniref:ABC transporter substrate-binding protein n=1 Tax=uncultured Dysosmobacter sp. TaxID=2591384 RepID=UPI002623F30B|nr:ABC transporter substrate-binding protein [uncultured Dysosmobacter sp.]